MERRTHLQKALGAFLARAGEFEVRQPGLGSERQTRQRAQLIGAGVGLAGKAEDAVGALVHSALL